MRLHIGNLPSSVTETDLRSLVTPFAEPKTLEIVTSSAGESKGFGFADFADATQAQAVITGLNGTEVGGNMLKIAEARPRRADMPKVSAQV